MLCLYRHKQHLRSANYFILINIVLNRLQRIMYVFHLMLLNHKLIVLITVQYLG